MNWNDQYLRIGLVGLRKAGKTVFLTSLIDNLKNFRPEEFRLRDGKHPVDILQFRQLPPKGKISPFPYEQIRTDLAHDCKWPVKTKASNQFRCAFTKEVKGRRQQVTLDLFDFAGERLADIGMGRGYDGWSDLMLNKLRQVEEHFPAETTAFFTALDEGADGERIVQAYRDLLVALAKDFHSLISPSTFLLDEAGEQISGANLATRPLGLKDRPVVPLPADLRERGPLADQFRRAFEKYKKQVVDPLISRLASSDRLVVLVSIPDVLSRGVAVYNDQLALIDALLELCTPPRNRLGWIAANALDWIGQRILPDAWHVSGVDRIAFVASQADRVRPGDIGRLKHLVERLVAHPVRNQMGRLGYDHKTFTCSSIVSCQATDDPKLPLQAQRAPGEWVQFTVPELPEDWPSEWPADQFRFPRTLPAAPKNIGQAPPQEGLDELLSYLLK